MTAEQACKSQCFVIQQLMGERVWSLRLGVDNAAQAIMAMDIGGSSEAARVRNSAWRGIRARQCGELCMNHTEIA